MTEAGVSKRSNSDTPVEQLKRARESFNNYMDATVKPLLNIEQRQLDRLRFAEIGKRIADESIRRDYRDRTIRLLVANIECDGPSARLRTVPEQDSNFVVASTLFVAAIAYMFGPGVVSGLIAAAIWFWLAAETASRRRRALIDEIRQHNDEVPDWAKTIEDWNADLLDLRMMD